MSTKTANQQIFCDIFSDEYEKEFGPLPRQQNAGNGSNAIDLGARERGFLRDSVIDYLLSPLRTNADESLRER